VLQRQNITISGATGAGKTFPRCAFGQQYAAAALLKVIYHRTSRLFDELTALARADGTYAKALARLARFDVLILDDWCATPLTAAERKDMSEIMEDRYGERSTIVISQRPSELWHAQIGDPTIADAICDRMLSSCHRIMLEGPSRR
jgi:DNA replication protein DnaC